MGGYINGKVEIWCGDSPPLNLNTLWQKRITNNGIQSTVMYEYNSNLNIWQVHNLENIAQNTGTSESMLMSQKSISDLFSNINTDIYKKSTTLDSDQSISYADNPTSYQYTPLSIKLNKKYIGDVSTNKRYLACGFDDFRSSDVSWVSPLFEKYGFSATFNRINSSLPTKNNILDIYDVFSKNHEFGDHSILHEMFIYYSPLWNGQDPASPEGAQVAFPTNNDFRQDRGDGKNIFGKILTDTIIIGYLQPDFGEKTWQELSDADCQYLRNWYSVIKNVDIINYLDLLSNEIIGTTGSSIDSWSGTEYSGGIFTGCKTSCNHEIWERICLIQKHYFKKYLGINQDITEWSLPGSKNAYLYLEDNGLYYYDREKTQPANDSAEFTSSIILDTNGDGINRSWRFVLRNNGYRGFHDCLYPGRHDGNVFSEMSNQYIINSSYSRLDGLVYPTKRDIDQSYPINYSEEYFDGVDDGLKKMYEDTSINGFRHSIESIRQSCARGIIAGGLWDSSDSYSDQIYWENILRFCRLANIEVVSKAEAYDIAFNRHVLNGNLLYNPNFDNIVEKVIPNASNIPTNPDGWDGSCSVLDDQSSPNGINKILVCTGAAYMKHFGVPTGNLTLTLYASGNGYLQIFKIRNKQNSYEVPDVSENIHYMEVSNLEFQESVINFNIKNEDAITSSKSFDGLDNKICGIYIYVGGNVNITQPKLILN